MKWWKEYLAKWGDGMMICHIKTCSYSICSVCNNMNDFDCEYKDYRAIGTTEECRIAVEKQTPKKPQLITRAGGSIKFYPCPTCSTSEKYEPVYPKQKYCQNCGQKLDWG